MRDAVFGVPAARPGFGRNHNSGLLHRHGAGLVLSVAFSMLGVWIYRRSGGARYRRSAPGRRRGPY